MVRGDYVQGMSERRRTLTTRLSAALLAAGLVTGCAGASDPGRMAAGKATQSAGGLTWAGYLYGEDLRDGCREGTADRYRLIFNAGLPGQSVRILELAGRPDKGGTMTVWQLAVSNVSQLGPGDPALPAQGVPGNVASLSAEQFQAVALRLARGGVFLPPHSQLDLGASKLRWFATGCFDGFYFLSAYTAQPGARQDISFIPQP